MTIFRYQKSHRYSRWIMVTMLGMTALTLAGCGSSNNQSNTNSTSSTQASSTIVASRNENTTSESSPNNSSSQESTTNGTISHTRKGTQERTGSAKKQNNENQADRPQSLANMNYQSGQSAVININNGQSTLDPVSWKVNNVEYTNLDGLNRTSTGNTAYLTSQNVANDSLRSSQTFKPTGYQQKFINNEPILNRGHEIAYSLSKGISANGRYEPNNQSGDQNNPKNLFTQTAFSNQKVQTIYESKVRNALKQGKKVIYQVQPIFQGNDLMAKGVHMQAISTDRTLSYNVYLYNVQPGVQFDYATGHSTVDHNMNVPTPAGAPTFHDNNKGRSYSSTEHNYPTKKHHYVRDAAIAGTAHHFIKRHYQKKYGIKKSHHIATKAVVGSVALHEFHKHATAK